MHYDRWDAMGAGLRVERVDEPSGVLIRLHGVVDENTDLSFFRALHGSVQLHLRGLHRINSYGVRSWMAAISAMAPDVELELVECPVPMVDQMNQLRGFLGRARVRSFLGPYICERCGTEDEIVIRVDDCRRNGVRLPDDVTCPRCRKRMEPDVVESLYLRFVREMA